MEVLTMYSIAVRTYDTHYTFTLAKDVMMGSMIIFTIVQ